MMCLHDEPETAARRRIMQLILDEVHGLQHEWEYEGNGEWAEAGIINSSRVLIVTGTHMAVEQLIARMQELTIANPVMDVNMPSPYHTKLMLHAVPKFTNVLQRCSFKRPVEGSPIILDPITTRALAGPPAAALVSELTHQLRWHKTLARLHSQPSPPVDEFLTVGRGAKGLGIMLRGEIKKRPENAPSIAVEEFGVANQAELPKHSSRPARPAPHERL
jgi:malonyl CoA-acyl carrier protein transacylase